MKDWTNSLYHDENGKVLGEIFEFGNKYKALGGNFFLGWFVSEEFAKKSVEEYIESYYNAEE